MDLLRLGECCHAFSTDLFATLTRQNDFRAPKTAQQKAARGAVEAATFTLPKQRVKSSSNACLHRHMLP